MSVVIHPIPPVFDQNSEVLILGSFPSVKSRQQRFFYGHPQNRFWRVLANVFETEVPVTVEEKTAFLLAYRVAVWDVVARCEIAGSADSSIKNVQPNDLSVILHTAKIRKVIVNGKTAERLYNRYLLPVTGLQSVCLPSTSPANAAKTLDELTAIWKREWEGIE